MTWRLMVNRKYRRDVHRSQSVGFEPYRTTISAEAIQAISLNPWSVTHTIVALLYVTKIPSLRNPSSNLIGPPLQKQHSKSQNPKLAPSSSFIFLLLLLLLLLQLTSFKSDRSLSVFPIRPLVAETFPINTPAFFCFI